MSRRVKRQSKNNHSFLPLIVSDFFGVWQLFSFSLRRGLWSNVCQVSPCLEVAVVFLSGVPRGDVIFCSLSSVVVPESICHFRHYKMDGSPVNCWLKQMVKIRKDKGLQGLQRGQTTRNYCLLEIKNKLSNRGRESQDGLYAIL